MELIERRRKKVSIEDSVFEENSARNRHRNKKAPEKRGLNNNEQIFKDNGGREERIRTSDPSVPNAVLYQTEPLPDFKMLK